MVDTGRLDFIPPIGDAHALGVIFPPCRITKAAYPSFRNRNGIAVTANLRAFFLPPEIRNVRRQAWLANRSAKRRRYSGQP